MTARADFAHGRALLAAQFLWQLLVTAKRQRPSQLTWRRLGGYEAEQLLEAIETGGRHPLLALWERRRSANRPAPGSGDLHVRMVACACVEALQRAMLPARQARRMVAAALAEWLPAEAVSGETLRHWRRGLGPLDEAAIEKVLDIRGHDHAAIVHHFMGLIIFYRDPFAQFLDTRLLPKLVRARWQLLGLFLPLRT
jgi:hypothetical protein